MEDVKRLPYTEAVLYESMRMYPPLPIMGRVASKATQVRLLRCVSPLLRQEI